ALVDMAPPTPAPGPCQSLQTTRTQPLSWSAVTANTVAVLGPAKGKDTSLTLGPVLVTTDELAPFRSGTAFDLRMTAAVNGEVIGTDRWDAMHFSYAEMIEYASRGTEIRPGDVLGSGTCGGGCLAELWGRKGRDAHPPLRPGDTVTISVDILGAITSKIVSYPDPPVADH
ncbi:fumarylacetoacetate hydrolase family protein, partial [Streptomyces antimycoticus]|uniref:fumarylacetoacetate hydrolase family protein n=1 Tax=Streptomyces antimycoticus TaxID=68175 RepID=UPI003432F0CD